MRAAAAAALLLAIFGVGAGLAASAAAAAERTESSISFALPSDNGFEIEFSAYGDGASFSADSKESGDGVFAGSSVIYLEGLSRVEFEGKIKEKVGRIGSVSVRFDERSSKTVDVPGCEADAVVRRGVFEGRFSFRGENGYAESSGRRAEGKLTESPANCDSVPVGRASELRRTKTTLLASCQPDSGAVYFAVGQRNAPPWHSVSVSDSLGGNLLALRSAYYTDNGRASFSVNAKGTKAVLRPRAAFAGSAEYADRKLRGDLAVELPGLDEPVALAPAKAKIKQVSGGSGAIEIGCGAGAAVAGVGRSLAPLLGGSLPPQFP